MSFHASTEANDAQLAPTRRWTRPLNSAAARRLRVSVDPTGNGIGRWGIPALPEPCSDHGCTGRRPCLSSGGVPAVPPNGIFTFRCLCFRRAGVAAKPINRMNQCAARACVGKHHLISCRAGYRQAPGDPVHALQQKRTGRRKIGFSPVGDSFRGLICVLFLHKTYSFFAAAAAEAVMQVLSRFCSKLRKLKGIIRLQSSNSALS